MWLFTLIMLLYLQYWLKRINDYIKDITKVKKYKFIHIYNID